MNVKSIIKTLTILIIGILIGLLGTRLLPLKPDKKVERKILYWVAPMDKNYKRNKPGKSPMGMDLVPVYADDNTNSSHKHGIKINPTVQNNIAIKVARATKQNFSNRIDTVGYVVADENMIDKINSYVDGWIRNLQVNTNGETVKKGQLLFELYSPTLISAEEEYLLALRNNKSLIQPSRQKLKTLGMSDSQINTLKQTKQAEKTLKVYAEVDGVISHLTIRDGAFIKPAQTLMMITDLSSIWVDAEVYDKDAALVKLGQKAMAMFNAYPNKEWLGELIFINPQLNPNTRTLKVRLAFPNPDLLLKPNMYADISIYANRKNNVLAIPLSAVIKNNNMSYVIVSGENNTFYAKEVIVGQTRDDAIEIKKGLTEGQKVVTSGQFLIDSESNVQQSLMRIGLQSKQKPISKEIIGRGKILAINSAKRTITLDHKPIEDINMPSMVMTFRISKSLNLNPFLKGDFITFRLRKNSNNEYEVCHIKKEARGDK